MKHSRDLLASPGAARAAGLRYVSDARPGITRIGAKKSFRYRGPDGRLIRDASTLNRIRHLAIPPAWTKVWICAAENGHIQATGRDARGRKQYRYHPHWRELRDESKYERVIAFGAVLPGIRRRLAGDLRKRELCREKVLASIVRLLETTLIRVGNDEYARENRSYGLTTLRNRHASVHGAQIVFEFTGKSGKKHRVGLKDPAMAKLVRRCQDLPGQELFGYRNGDGTVHNVNSEDVNGYIRELSRDDFSAKDFRTWAGTVLAAVALRELGECTSQRQARRNVARAVEAVAKMLGNTPAVCRKCYVHPEILRGYFLGETIATFEKSVQDKLRPSRGRLRAEELAVMKFLRNRLERRKRPAGV